MVSQGFKVWTEGDYNLNLFGIRSPDRGDAYNDLIGCAYKAKGQWRVCYWAATTDPSEYYRRKPVNYDGAAILVPGQYRGAYVIGNHRGYKALVQRNAPVRVYRDNNRDAALDMDRATIQTGFFGINIHASYASPYEQTVDRSPTDSAYSASAGCQVHATTTGFREMMTLAQAQVDRGMGETFTYTLLDRWW
jgi:hypothetical protein